MRDQLRYQFGILLVPAMLAGCALTSPARAPTGATATLALLETSDLHSNVVSYDYYKLAPDQSLGLERTATLIAAARAEFPNTMLLDNGDTIQGTALADYQALAKPIACDQTLAIYKAMNHLGFEGSGIGNHEFNYGLAYLSQVTGSQFDVDGVDPARPRCAGPNFPQVLANIYSVKSKQPLFAPYRIIDKQIKALDAEGKPITATLKVGIIGFTPPTILSWDKRWLDGKLYTVGVLETANKFIPEMKAKGADLIVVISHGGLDDSPYTPDMENGNYHLTKVPGVDAMLIGHSHQAFPNARSAIPQFNLPGVDKAAGLVNGVPTTMPSMWGKHLGVIGLRLRFDGSNWVVEKDRTTVEARAIQMPDKSFVAPVPGMASLIAAEHTGTLDYVKTPIGATTFRMSTYFADVGDTTALAVINEAQADYTRRAVQVSLPQYASLPVLAMAAPFKGGFAGVSDYTDVAAGPLAINNAADLYLFPNVLHVVKVDGAGLKVWLEKTAERFHRIDPAKTGAQELANPAHQAYNFDAMTSDEVRYEIDITQAPGQRIRELRFRGAPVTDAQQFLVATNNYRASGGGEFPGLDGSKTVLAAPDTVRDVLIEYVRTTKTLTRERFGQSRSWRFTKVKTAGPVVFHSAPGMLDLAHAAGLANVSLLKNDDGLGKGNALYAIDLSK